MSYKNLLVAVEPNQEARTIAARAREIAPNAEISVLAVLPDVVQAYGTVWSGDASGAMLDFVTAPTTPTKSRRPARHCSATARKPP